MEFIKFPKIGRYSRDVIVTEKIDGTNAQLFIPEDGRSIQPGSRNKYISPDCDNYGFSQWAVDHHDELLKLGPGRHFGEWWGSGIQRGYGLTGGDKRFSLFNVTRWREETLPDCVGLVPALWEGPVEELNANEAMDVLWALGSAASPGFHNPEGIVIYHTGAKVCLKKTFEKDGPRMVTMYDGKETT